MAFVYSKLPHLTGLSKAQNLLFAFLLAMFLSKASSHTDISVHSTVTSPTDVRASPPRFKMPEELVPKEVALHDKQRARARRQHHHYYICY